jgi:hypothetical protein
MIESKDVMSRRIIDMASFDSRIWAESFEQGAEKFIASGTSSYFS